MIESSEDAIYKLKDIRVLINDGYNDRGVYLSGETCKAIVRWIDEVILYIMETGG